MSSKRLILRRNWFRVDDNCKAIGPRFYTFERYIRKYTSHSVYESLDVLSSDPRLENYENHRPGENVPRLYRERYSDLGSKSFTFRIVAFVFDSKIAYIHLNVSDRIDHLANRSFPIVSESSAVTL